MEETYQMSWDKRIMLYVGYAILTALIALAIHELIL